ncbi:diguanylate cyclase domain-containing protein [Clostridium isatidis]|uniref:diguanylate cyclase domain-containing protein n=1 Tax=Clostridium isatidis TaxID=182773 RepID=UPI003AAE6AC5
MVVESSKNKMEGLRELINEMIVSDNYDSDFLVQKSQELDKLIVQAMKEKSFVKKVFGNDYVYEFELVVDKIKAFDKMYDSMRIVDPIKKEVLEIKEGELRKVKSFCYKIWYNDYVCENCISSRACISNEIVVKVDLSGNKILMMVAIPIKIYGKNLSLELFKDITMSFLIENRDKNNDRSLFDLIKNMNQVAVKDKVTGLYSKKYIYERLPADIIKASIENQQISIIFLDLDFYKSNNNNLDDIDYILKELADNLNKIMNIASWAARYEEDKLLIVIPNAGTYESDNIESVQLFIEGLIENILKNKYFISNKEIELNPSYGIYNIPKGNEELNVEEIIKRARKNLKPVY